MKDQYLEEINWISKRLVEIYENCTEKNSIDIAIIILSINHHFLHVAKLLNEKVRVEEAIQYSLNKIKLIIMNQLENDEVFFNPLLFKPQKDRNLESELEVSLNTLLSKLEKDDTDSRTIEYIQFILDELTTESPKVYVMESVLASFEQILNTDQYQEEVRHIIQLFRRWKDK